MCRSSFAQLLMVLSAGALLAVVTAEAQPMRDCEFDCVANELAKLLASDGAERDSFGFSVAISGVLAVAGAHRDDDNGDSSGSAYLFAWDGASWVEEAKLLPSDGEADDKFGWSVAISGDTVVVGAYYDDNENGSDAGAAYIFRYDGSNCVEEAKLLASDGATYDRFGQSAAISGNVALIGACDDAGAYVFRHDGSNWVEEAKLLASDWATGDNFAEFLSISGDTAVVGAWCDDDNGQQSGSAYVFRHDGSNWVEEAKLLPSDGAAEDHFGNGVAVFGGCILVGGRGNDDSGTDSGSAYVFRYDGSAWVEEAKLLASDGAAGDSFGNGVALSGDIALIDACYDDDNGDRSGSAYVFRYDGLHWLEQAKLLASDGAPEDELGYLRGVAVSDGAAMIGAQFNDDYGTSSGSAYAFHGLSDCQPNGVLDICDINNGTSEDANGNGVPDECESPECPGDLDGDLDIDLADLAQLLAHYGLTQGAIYEDGDIDLDGDVDLTDLAALLAVYGTACE